MKSFFGKVFVSFVLILGLTAASCNQRSSDVRVNEGDEDIRMREHNVDSVRQEDEGYGDTKVRDNTRIDMERDRNEVPGGIDGTNRDVQPSGQGSSSTQGSTSGQDSDPDQGSSTQGNRGTNQGNDTRGDAGSERR